MLYTHFHNCKIFCGEVMPELGKHRHRYILWFKRLLSQGGDKKPGGVFTCI